MIRKYFYFLCKLIVNSYGWKSAKSLAGDERKLQLQKLVVAEPLGIGRLTLIQTIFGALSSSELCYYVNKLPDATWNALFAFFSDHKNNNCLQVLFLTNLQNFMMIMEQQTLTRIWIKLNSIGSLRVVVEQIYQNNVVLPVYNPNAPNNANNAPFFCPQNSCLPQPGQSSLFQQVFGQAPQQ